MIYNFYYNLLILGKSLIEENSANLYSMCALKAAILQWLASPCILTIEAYDTATFILKLLCENRDIKTNTDLKKFAQEFKDQLCTNKNIFHSVNISIQLEHLINEEYLSKFVENIKNTPHEFKSDNFNFLCSLMLIDHKNPDISVDVLDMLLKCVQNDISLSPKLLTLIFYKISNNQQPKFNFALLKSLPKMVILRDNIPKVVAAIQAISKGSENLYNIGLSLAFDVWRLDHKCYTFLEDLLVNNPSTRKKWERNIIKAVILKELCEKK